MQSALSPSKIPLPTVVGLVLSLLFPLLYGLVIAPLFLKPYLSSTAYILNGFVVQWLTVLAILAIVRYGEQKPWSSIGLQGLSWKSAAIAFGIGTVLSLSVPLLTFLASQIIPPAETGTIGSNTAQIPVWLLFLGVITAGVTEEVLYRAYPLERLIAITGQPWLSAAITLIVFVLAHIRGWSLAHLIAVVIPLGAILTGLYLWKRNLPFVMMIHILIDLPLVFLAMAASSQ